MPGAGDVELYPGATGEAALIAKAAGSRPLSERVAAVKALARRTTPGGTRALATLLRAREAPSALRAAAAVALGKQAGEESGAALLGALAVEDPAVLRRVAGALGRVGGAAALPRLRALPVPKDPATARAVGFARSLIAYRHGLAEDWLKPASAIRLRLPPGAGTALRPEPLGTGTIAEIEAQLGRELPATGVVVSGGVGLTCRGDMLALLPAADAARAARESAVPAVLLKGSHCLANYSVQLYLLSHPLGGGRFALFGVRPDGTLTHAGEARAETGGFGFQLEALDTPLAPPTVIAGHLHTGPPRITLAEARVGTQAEAKRPPARSPMRVLPPLPVTRTGPAKRG
jgi:hypothetical protein